MSETFCSILGEPFNYIFFQLAIPYIHPKKHFSPYECNDIARTGSYKLDSLMKNGNFMDNSPILASKYL